MDKGNQFLELVNDASTRFTAALAALIYSLPPEKREEHLDRFLADTRQRVIDLTFQLKALNEGSSEPTPELKPEAEQKEDKEKEDDNESEGEDEAGKITKRAKKGSTNRKTRKSRKSRRK